MPTGPRIIDPNGVYHIYCRGNNKAQTFVEERDYRRFLSLVLEAKYRYDPSIYHYVLMPNHFHLLLKPNSGNIPAFMHAIKLGYAKYYAQTHGHSGHVWQGRYKSKAIKDDAYLFACGNYIEMNPVRAGLVKAPQDWPYTSYGRYAFGKNDPIIDYDPYFPTLGQTAEARRLQYRKLIATTRVSSSKKVAAT